MKHKKLTNREIANLMSQNQSFENYFSNYYMSKNNIAIVDKNHNELHFVVDWQMENNSQDISVKFK